MKIEAPGLTIDGPTTRDIDDAIHLERVENGWRIRVSIADVARAVVIGSPTDEVAKARVATRYFATGNSPMLDRRLAEGDLSLWPGRMRDVLVVDFTVGTDFETREATVYEARLRSAARLTYSEIPALMESSAGFGTMLNDAKTVALGMLAKRRDAGALVLYDLNNGWVSTEDGFIKKLEAKTDTVGYIIIQELMIRANAEVARFGEARGAPLLFRNHEARDAGPELERLIQTIREGTAHPIIGLDNLRQDTHRLLQKASYGASCAGHFGLNLPSYVHFTSPIRRYADLVNHRQIKAVLRGEPVPYTVEALADIAQAINFKTAQDQQAMTDMMKARANGQAQRALEDRRIDGLDMKQFERVIKQAVLQTDAPDFLVQGFSRRLEEKRVPMICMTIVFGQTGIAPGWMAIKERVIEALFKNPADAVGILAQCAQLTAIGWPPATYSVEARGPDHLRTFLATASLPGAQAQATARTSKEAQQRAALRLLALKAGMTQVPVYQDAEEPTPPSAAGPPEKADTSNCVGALQEFCQQRGIAPPEYAFKQEGPPHLPVVTCTCTFDGVARTGVASSKKDAKQRAAEGMLVYVTGKFFGHIKGVIVD